MLDWITGPRGNTHIPNIKSFRTPINFLLHISANEFYRLWSSKKVSIINYYIHAVIGFAV